MKSKDITYLNGILYALKMACKIINKIENKKSAINFICILQKMLILNCQTNKFKSNCDIWQFVERQIKLI